MPNWRTPPTAVERSRISSSASTDMQNQWYKGIEHYGPVFVGDPFDHLDAELGDGKVYSNYARRKMNEAVALLEDALKQPNIDPTLRTTIDAFVSDHYQREPKEDPLALLRSIRAVQAVRLSRGDAPLGDKLMDKVELCLRQQDAMPTKDCSIESHHNECNGTGPDCAAPEGVGEHHDQS